MRNVTAILLVVGVFLAASASSIWASAAEEEKGVVKRVDKFSRGVVNVGTSPLEIPKQMVKRAQNARGADGQLAGYISGAITGVGWGIWRLTSGIADIVSAPFSENEEGLIEPEFVSDDNPLTHPLYD
jgi:putative exosortase-associated protein (TIGR04073 family)